MSAISKSEREDFRAFCRQATDFQLLNIVAKEREAASRREHFAPDAEAIAIERGLEIPYDYPE